MKTLKQVVESFKNILEDYMYDTFNRWDKTDCDNNAVVIGVHCDETPITPGRLLIFIIKDNNVDTNTDTDTVIENINMYTEIIHHDTEIIHHDGKIADYHDVITLMTEYIKIDL